MKKPPKKKGHTSMGFSADEYVEISTPGAPPATEGALRLAYGADGKIVIRDQNDGDNLTFMEMFSNLFRIAEGMAQCDVENWFMRIDAPLEITSLPNSDPAISGRLWNDGGTVKISAG
jgi:hypothetical protein